MKSYTDIEQSKKLAEFLPIESADMRFPYFVGGQYGTTALFGEPIEFSAGKDVPCWSLAALLDVLPLGIYDEFDYNDYELEINMIDKMPRYIRLGDITHSKFPWDFEKDTLIDNIVESIIWLKDNNYFKL